MRGVWAELRKGHRARWLFAASAVLAICIVLLRGPISRALVPDPRMNQQLQRAQAALAAGRLSARDGSGARELFESVLASDPDQMIARDGLVRVRSVAIERAQRGLAERRLGTARRHLELAQALSAPAVQLQPLLVRLHDLETASSDVTGLLAQAASTEDETAALAVYQQVLLLDAENSAALEGRRELLANRLARAEALLDERRVHEAQQLVDQVVRDDAAHLDLPPVQVKLGEALASVQRENEKLLRRAQAEERARRFESAGAIYLKLRESMPDDPAITDALDRLAQRMAERARREAADFEFKRAEASLAIARRWSPESSVVLQASEGVRRSRAAGARLSRPQRRGQARVPGLIADAEQAIASGDLTSPPGASAWDKLRVAAGIAPESAEVGRVHRLFLEGARDCFDHAMIANQLKRASYCLEAQITAEPGAAEIAKARRGLADRCLAYADERMGASDYLAAEQALAMAGRWQPAHPQLQASQMRLRRARGLAAP